MSFVCDWNVSSNEEFEIPTGYWTVYGDKFGYEQDCTVMESEMVYSPDAQNNLTRREGEKK